MKKAILLTVASTMMAQATFAQTPVSVNTDTTVTMQGQMDDKSGEATLDAISAQVVNMMLQGDGSISQVQLQALSQSIAALPAQSRLALIDASIVRINKIKEALRVDVTRFGQVAGATFVSILAGLIAGTILIVAKLDRESIAVTAVFGTISALSLSGALYADKLETKDIEKLNRMAADIGTALLQVRAGTLSQIQANQLK